MKVKLTDGTEVEIQEEQLTNKEIIEVEKAVGQSVAEFDGSMTLITYFVWLTMRRDNPKLKFDDVEFTLVVDDDEEETPKARTKKK